MLTIRTYSRTFQNEKAIGSLKTPELEKDFVSGG